MKDIDSVFIIAELSANHNNDFDLAVRTIKEMAKSGANAVKVQTYKPESLTLDLSEGHFAIKKEGLWKGYNPWDLYSEAAMPYDWQPKLKTIANQLGMVFFSSPFDFEAVDFLESIEVPMYKIASMEINDIPLIKYTASKGKPIIISTGVADEDDIWKAINACNEVGNFDVSILKCTSEYPATIDQANLSTIPDMVCKFKVNVGVSDHTLGSTVPVVAVALGAKIVEKHFILSRELGGPDAAFSLEPNEFSQMVNEVRNAEKALGKVCYKLSEKDKVRRRSIFAVQDIRRGEEFTHENVRSIRPGVGLAPEYFYELIGRTAKRNISKGEPILFEDI